MYPDNFSSQHSNRRKRSYDCGMRETYRRKITAESLQKYLANDLAFLNSPTQKMEVINRSTKYSYKHHVNRVTKFIRQKLHCEPWILIPVCMLIFVINIRSPPYEAKFAAVF